MTSFRLTTEPWILCQGADGASAHLSMRDVFDGEHPVVGLRGDSPTQDYAVLRVLLTVFLRAHAAALDREPVQAVDFVDWWEREWEDATSDSPDEVVLEYLDDHAERFDLLHPLTPFMQVANLRTAKDSRLPVSRIIPEAEGDLFTMRTGEARTTIPFAEAARWLIHTHAYDYSGIKPGAVGDPRVKGGKGYPIGQGWTGLTGGTTILGRSLRETVLLNATEAGVFGGTQDRAAWEREPDGPCQRALPEPAGVADLLTWQSRRVKLFHDGERVTEVLVSNGDPVPRAGANIFTDPMTPYRFSTNKSTKQQTVYYPRPYDTSRMMWRSLEPLICLEGDHPSTGSLALRKGEHAPKRPSTLDQIAELRELQLASAYEVMNIRLTSASYGSQASSTSATVDARVDVPRALLHPDNAYARLNVIAAARLTNDAAICIGQFAGDLLQAAGGEYAFQIEPTDGLLSELEPRFRAWLRGVDAAASDAAIRQWQQTVRSEVLERAQILLRGAGPRALIGREVIENDRTVLHSAGTAHLQLLKRLKRALPSAHPGEAETPGEPGTATEKTIENKETSDVA